MNKVLVFSFIGRFLLTPIIALGGKNYYKLVFLLILLDVLDCNPLIIKLFPQKELQKQQYCSRDPIYSEIDKWLDLYQYLFAIYIYRDLFTSYNLQLLLLMFFYRFVGVLSYHYNKNPMDFVIFPDLIKEFIVLVALYNNQVPTSIILLMIFGKVIYEFLMHKKNVMLYLYKKIFE